MKKAPRKKVAGVGTALGAVVLGSIMWLGCQPGVLPCDKDPEWKGICAGGDALPPPNPATTGGSGGSPNSGTGGSPGTGGMPMTGAKMINETTQVADCGQYKTLGDMDMFFEVKCGSGGNLCHGTGAPFGDFKGNKMWERGTTTKTKFACMGTFLIDPADETKGAFWAKLNAEMRCGGMLGKMPPSNAMMAQMISADEKKCLENYFKKIAGK
jgi:hypothetical protein